MSYKPAATYSTIARDVTIGLGALALVTGLEGKLGPAVGQDASAKGTAVAGLTYELPKIDGLKPFAQNRLDIFKDIPGAETIAKFYRSGDGGLFATLHVAGPSGKEIIYGYAVNINPTTGIPGAYLLNLNGKGQFEAKQPGGSFEASWVAEHFKRG